ncbi:hypothetical protein ADN00_09215 [Ornatilinea apprima]|uniref:Uncharacterized protein n=1 Tax=Ornatilinea apprima TaxID=1134406 RepID=A0A0P6XBY4_9CHLR|nr:hypothetical protein ADN00_09215 [Ornatilinea apprima]
MRKAAHKSNKRPELQAVLGYYVETGPLGKFPSAHRDEIDRLVGGKKAAFLSMSAMNKKKGDR